VIVGAVAMALGAALVAEVAISVVFSIEAAEAVEPPVLEAPALSALELSPLVSSSLARFASADCRAALACSSVTSALCGSSDASSWPCVTCSPWVT
jgi:hypothetical protein